MSGQQMKTSAVNEYFLWLENHINPDTALYRAAHSYLEEQRASFQNKESDGDPFLSIITRTQGKRPEMLTETLLSLTGQQNTDFELLIMGHNLTQEQHSTVCEIIEELPEWMRSRTRLIPVTGGTRTTPLNQGFAAARGEYIAILDDDDIAFDNWVSAFYNAAQTSPGKVLHAYTVFQDWENLKLLDSEATRAVGSPENKYCRDFNLAEQLKLNTCPPGGLAFPAYAFRELGIRFDESLTTTEDWDYLMRCAFVTGVCDCREVTFLYRNWVNADNSRTMHGQEEWDKNYQTIINRFQQTPVLLPASEVAKLFADDEEESISQEPANTPPDPNRMELFYDNGNGFSEEYKKKGQSTQDSDWTMVVSGFHPDDLISKLRLDPYDIGGVTVGNLHIQVVTTDEKNFSYSLKNVTTNGIEICKHIVFVKNDPQIEVKLPYPVSISKVFIRYDLQHSISDETIALLGARFPLLYRLRRKLKTFLRKIRNWL